MTYFPVGRELRFRPSVVPGYDELHEWDGFRFEVLCVGGPGNRRARPRIALLDPHGHFLIAPNVYEYNDAARRMNESARFFDERMKAPAQMEWKLIGDCTPPRPHDSIYEACRRAVMDAMRLVA